MWGHPETTGLPTIDYYLSGRDLEPDGAEAHYTEQLIRLPNLGCHYARRADSPATPQIEGLDLQRDRPLLLCPGTTFKYMPQHDWVYAEIARRVGSCRFVFFSQQPQWTSLLRERLRAAFRDRGLDVDAHVSFIAWLAKPQFIGLMQQADVFLDTIGFSGFNTAMQAVECGLPIVTRRGRFMRGRLAGAILARMRMAGLIAETDEDYVRLVALLAGDAQYRQRVRQEMQAREQVLFDDLEPIRALERLLVGVCRTSSPQEARQGAEGSAPAPGAVGRGLSSLQTGRHGSPGPYFTG
jgi:predicted O-linked N-acetylglucosamine transferase (SPINDLY family)